MFLALTLSLFYHSRSGIDFLIASKLILKEAQSLETVRLKPRVPEERYKLYCL